MESVTVKCHFSYNKQSLEIQETRMATSNQRIVEFSRICNFITVPFEGLVPAPLLLFEGSYRTGTSKTTVNPTDSLLAEHWSSRHSKYNCTGEDLFLLADSA